MKKYTLLFLVLLSISGYAQNTINNYKYVIVPEKYSFLKQTDQYKLNTLTKALLQDKGFTAYFDNSDLPNEIANNKCGALTVDVLEKNSMFSTNLTIVLKDCYGKTVLESKQGKSREKEFAVSYNLALRDAFTSISDTPYSYQAAADAQNKPAVATTTTASAPASATTTSVPVSANVPVQSAPVSSGLPATASAAVPAGTVAAANAQPAANATKSAVAAESKLAPGTLYAQPTSTGYQLIDTAPKIILSLYKTSVENYFIAGNGTANGIVFKKGDNWVFEYYNNGQLESQKLLIKF
ncbi:MAG: hypothetical protein ABWY16_19940 [Pedobacter sp.]|uniref:hypothetical protein n=1 Tax=Pedobacter sp. TaxID=1411316 RepID=UPI0033913A8C